MNICFKICYLGSNYHGFQKQKEKISIQGVIEDVFYKIFKIKVNIIGCSRTDAGVHAKEFYFNIHLDNFRVSCVNIKNALNTYLPYDIRILDVFYVDEKFHSRYDALKKEYEYKIFNGDVMDPFKYQYYMHFRYELDFNSMYKACKYFEGEHDFRAFMSSNSSIKNTIRIIFKSSIYKEDNIIIYNILGNGFLYNMVRIIVGTLIMVGQGKIESQDIQHIIKSRNRNKAGFVSEAKGLCLKKVFYEN
ncbi:tRNA pseudouridine synthase [Candidatus Arthromitus sp. SFB-mouse-Japan]|uniref:tRNA pseudouridine(38-40) synthase TruA n=1 Tax=Candidatus Arthromitus sp. SFB-mouse TaxID=49118 RepID=UPI00021B8131|nr:tRNA pseudouridine(38-40) synthase TruA [Candidatus Arthromitus sp. SFB-mouse]EIA27622.1 tRNA pseudouridine synthase A [Candidatus Arthromitus sp. SFB-4]EIA28851.1 tRNA pseudouridine synthase A [Candidatus Arthromitus sp. SFB-co]EIA30141.1 tRNA pseudouridine synthase A [Candidatus Arthromitus sp. SFB-mouse-SU]EGX28194.1 tRNA pseudouridine synthase A [Candidatus Arthromitus sp. SFB-mouse-NYU]BAK57123.1 tRNA pseudouridine synthase [Candidatus Arthromitus sp. SFB-mouse-Japan]